MVARWRINRLHLHVDGDVVQLLGLWASENIFFPLMRSGHRQPLNKQTRACHAASATLSPSMGDICNEHVSTLSVEIFGRRIWWKCHANLNWKERRLREKWRLVIAGNYRSGKLVNRSGYLHTGNEPLFSLWVWAKGEIFFHQVAHYLTWMFSRPLAFRFDARAIDWTGVFINRCIFVQLFNIPVHCRSISIVPVSSGRRVFFLKTKFRTGQNGRP